MQFRKTKQVSAGTMLLEQTLALTSQFDQPMDQDGHDAMDVGPPWPVPRHRPRMRLLCACCGVAPTGLSLCLGDTRCGVGVDMVWHVPHELPQHHAC